jgi:hypothetical protein
MGRITVGKQPYSDLASQSLRDFLKDQLFEFHLFHKIAKDRFYKPSNASSAAAEEQTPGNQEQRVNLIEKIADKRKPRQTLLQKLFSTAEKSSLPQVFNEESNYFFVKRLHNESWSVRQYAEYLKLTEMLNNESIKYYKMFQSADPTSPSGSVQESVGESRLGLMKKSESTRWTGMLSCCRRYQD